MEKRKKPGVRAIAAGIILVVSILFLLVGLLQGGFGETLNKAVRICMECIGVG